MRKEYLDKLKKENPQKYQKVLEQQRKRGKRKRKEKRQLVLEQRKSSPYWQVSGYHRYKRRIFQTMANRINIRCKRGKTDALTLWGIAKKQKLICPLSGEKLTIENLSVDHIIPISKGGTNDKSNLQLITRQMNTIKNNMTTQELFLFCKNIIHRLAPMVDGDTTLNF